MKMLKIVLQLLLLFTIHQAEAAKILAVFLTPSMDLDAIYITLIQELAGRGHEVTLVTANPVFTNEQVPDNITEIDVHAASHRLWLKYRNVITSNQNIDTASQIKLTLETANRAFEEQLKTDKLKKLLEEKHSYFDLLLLDAGVIPLLSFSNTFKAPVILLGSESAMEYYDTGASTHPFLYLSIFRQRLYNLTTWEKTVELCTNIRLKFTFESHEKKCDLMLKKYFGPGIPSLNYLKNNIQFMFLNTNPIWEDNRPVPPNVIYIGGVQPRTMQELPQDVQAFLDKSQHGVIFVSFGNVIKPSLLPPKKILTILSVLSTISYDVLLKWDTERLPGVPKHIKIYKGISESSILNHHKIKLFITNGGLSSTYKSIFAGVPLIGIPMFPDQHYNAKKYVYHHIGTKLDLTSLMEEKLTYAIKLVLTDETYRHNIADLRALMYDQPETQLERAIRWTEVILRHGAARQLQSPAATMSWAEYFELGLILTILFILSVTITVLIVVIILSKRYVVETFNYLKKKMK